MKPLPPIIQSLNIKSFRSMQNVRIDLENPTFLVGRNGSGKSNFVDAFHFLSDAMTLPLSSVFGMRGGITAVRNRPSPRSYPPHLVLAVKFGALNGKVQEAKYAFEIAAETDRGFRVTREQCLVIGTEQSKHSFDRNGDVFKSNVKSLEPSIESTALGLPVVGGNPIFAPVFKTISGMRTYAIDPGKLKDMQDPGSEVSLRPDGSNATSVLREIERTNPQDFESICEILASIVPNTKSVTTIPHGNKLALEFTQEWGDNKKLKFESFSMSDGTLRALGLLMAVYQKPSPTVLVIEEPEATIHPGALGAVLDLLRIASKKMQVIVTTHSPEILDAEWIEEKHLRIVDWKEGATRITPISDLSRKALEEHLMGAGELLRSNALQPSEEPFTDIDDFKNSLPLF